MSTTTDRIILRAWFCRVMMVHNAFRPHFRHAAPSQVRRNSAPASF